MGEDDSKVCLYQNLDSMYYDYLKFVGYESCINCKENVLYFNCSHKYLIDKSEKERRILDDFKIWKRSLDIKIMNR